ncbi:MAG: 5'/3'-nucleotidase SurE [Myxococcales bacterium]|nr:5'/3'-nucleotidase SurE [Myxococcales bacterium]MCB9544938.1 5'/3'-nucleotidase SurE [Myxococcales bacterium]
MGRQIALVTNDDGIQSWYLRVLVEALQRDFEVRVAAPARPQSWVGRAMTCRGEVAVAASDAFGCPAWAIDGTPADCVQLGLAHLLDAPPDVVVSGINIGLNVTLPLILGSGTVAGAIEGALQGHRAVATSMHLPSERFAEIHASHGRVDGDLADAARAAAQHAAAFARALADTPVQGPVVHNLNYPQRMSAEAVTVRTVPAQRRFRSLFGPTEAEGVYRFRFQRPEPVHAHPEDDDTALFSGKVSHTVLDLAAIGHPAGR